MTEGVWLARVGRVAGAVRADSAGGVGARHWVYVVLLRDTRRHEPLGLYVGQTSRDPDWRFDQHKAGYKASRAVRRFGERLLPEIVAHLNPHAGWETLDLEAGLADAFRAAGFGWVEGGH